MSVTCFLQMSMSVVVIMVVIKNVRIHEAPSTAIAGQDMISPMITSPVTVSVRNTGLMSLYSVTPEPYIYLKQLRTQY